MNGIESSRSVTQLQNSNENEVISEMCVWHTDEDDWEHPLIVKVVHTQDSNTGELKIFNKGNQVFSFNPDLYPESVFILDDGNLATLWSHGNGTRHFYVFGESKGKFRVLIDAVSKLDPEYVYQQKGHFFGSAELDKNGRMQVRGGPFFEHRIIISDLGWVLLKKPYLDLNRDLQPITADIFTWNEKIGAYEVRKKVPWLKRLESL